VGNDVTERMWQHAGPQWALGKSFDTHAPMGPWIVTADELGDPHRLGIRCFVNGEKRQDSNTSIWCSTSGSRSSIFLPAMTLEPGDVPVHRHPRRRRCRDGPAPVPERRAMSCVARLTNSARLKA
jgi:2-keto-4-pentenoate hydratase/2-oxohepta-3-ene-1,7-dioic acid hydratase in catechol pathway